MVSNILTTRQSKSLFFLCAIFSVALKASATPSTDESKCREVEIGDSKVINLSDTESPTGVQMRYVLQKKSAEIYRVGISPIFYEGKQLTVPNSQKPAAVKMRERLKSCLRRVNPGLLGPDGQRMEIYVLEPNDPNYLNVVVPIEVTTDEKFRPVSSKYPVNISCGTMAHEVGHLLGLVDEYSETDTASSRSGQLYDCRSKSVKPSLMSLYWEKIWASNRSLNVTVSFCVPKALAEKNHLLTVYSPTCAEGSFLGEMDVVTPTLDSDTTDTETRIKEFIRSIQASWSAEEEEMKDVKVMSYRAAERLTGSLLRNGHFRSIVHPLCEAKNSLFYRCSRSAYETSRKRHGIVFARCEKQPYECRDDTWLD